MLLPQKEIRVFVGAPQVERYLTGKETEGTLRQKHPRLVLNQEEYDQLKKRVLNRDGWKCQSCGTSTNLQVHHLVYRSQLGPDTLENLMTLCTGCHRREHNQSERACRVDASAL